MIVEFLLASAAVILVSMVISLSRALRGPSLADKLIVLQLFGTAGVGMLLLLGRALDGNAYFDAAFIVALLASVTAASVAARRRPAAQVLPSTGEETS